MWNGRFTPDGYVNVRGRFPLANSYGSGPADSRGPIPHYEIPKLRKPVGGRQPGNAG